MDIESSGVVVKGPRTPVLVGDREELRTRTGRVITEAEIDGWAREAEAGYDVNGLIPHPVGSAER